MYIVQYTKLFHCFQTGEERKDRGRKPPEVHFQCHMTKQHPELVTPTQQLICKECKDQFNRYYIYEVS